MKFNKKLFSLVESYRDLYREYKMLEKEVSKLKAEITGGIGKPEGGEVLEVYNKAGLPVAEYKGVVMQKFYKDEFLLHYEESVYNEGLRQIVQPTFRLL
jgi:hypothetical protein